MGRNIFVKQIQTDTGNDPILPTFHATSVNMGVWIIPTRKVYRYNNIYWY